MILQQIEAPQHVIAQPTPSRVTLAGGRWFEPTRPVGSPDQAAGASRFMDRVIRVAWASEAQLILA
jgi:hypothetical protein